MRYRGKYSLFDPNKIHTYPVAGRRNRVRGPDLVYPSDALAAPEARLEDAVRAGVAAVADAVIAARAAGAPVVLFCGAHPIKNGLGPLIIDLLERGMVTLVATNGAGAIHDFELALIGETSEDVPDALPKGRFGMAYEFCYFNEAVNIGHAEGLGFGESLGRTIEDPAFRAQVFSRVERAGAPSSFAHPEFSVLAAAYRGQIPMTVHATIGTDVVDQHPSFDAAAKGGASGRDLLIFTNEISKMTDGGVVLNLSCAVTGPEVLLKAMSMAGNVGRGARGIVTADFDLREACPEAMRDESAVHYYYRDQKSIVMRIPAAFGGTGYYIQGDHRATWPALYRAIVQRATGERE